ncbi:hypothetical protein V6N11_043278 [Hibiscus sabdariffa]|uniref:RNase H type-1 domain-containing protein n=1 Tax=Hibiscus sabdariffa TaxID=183260 RepID=A0ABR2QZ21_9ROSI
MLYIWYGVYLGQLSLPQYYGNYGRTETMWSFNLSESSFNAILHRSITWARYYDKCRPSTSTVQFPTADALHWKASEKGWICLNTDRAISPPSDIGSIGCVFRDNEGSWILGFNKSISIAQPLQAEL